MDSEESVMMAGAIAAILRSHPSGLGRPEVRSPIQSNPSKTCDPLHSTR
ncbi:hypothetical protein [Spirulina major]|nr:hypothetical protein [Spirulina major]